MSVIRRSHLSDFTRGGQTTLHFLRMIGQVLLKFGGFVIVCYVGFVGVHFMLNTTAYERYVGLKWVIAKAAVYVLKNGDSPVPFALADGRTVQVRQASVLADRTINETVRRQLRVISRGVAWALVALAIGLILLIGFIHRTGLALRTDQFLRGGHRVQARDLSKQLKRAGQASDLQIAGIALVRGSETAHLLISGSPGSGKSLAIRELLDGIRRRGERAIVYSTAGEFIEHYYRSGERDRILNPLDARCPPWHIWAEGRTPADFDTIAASLIPESPGSHDPFWNLAARTLFSTLAMRMKRLGNHSTAQLLRDLLTIKLEEAAELVKGTEAAAIIAQGAEKTALSVRSTLAAYIRSLKFLRSEGEVFSIRDWVHEDQGDGWIFIASRPDQKETLRPLITLWLDMASASILSLKPDRHRRIWIVIDELPSLNKLPSLPELLAQGRKFGGCCVLGFQSYAQLCGIYSRTGAEALTGLCSTWVLYRANEPATAEWSSKALGNAEHMEAHEGLSYGANEIRDGMTLSLSRQLRPLVLPTELLNLPDREGYLRLPGDWPVGHFTLPITPRKPVAEAFIEGDLSSTSWDFSSSATHARQGRDNPGLNPGQEPAQATGSADNPAQPPSPEQTKRILDEPIMPT